MFDDVNRLFFLRISLVVVGLTFIFGIYTLGMLWPSGWVWGQGYSHYLMMIMFRMVWDGGVPLQDEAQDAAPLGREHDNEGLGHQGSRATDAPRHLTFPDSGSPQAAAA